ncbi:hypothetical protein FA15DRAFT_596785 [Coprinopsis marcescibilis]|uniref:Uncharacterized protein n=1 Tax=Coprinopsis marcescibilis TaxID=230819 RepID=A0A5C3KQE1_COPMA|nr:hypothetical protein FA15DRAFT_596785 [Coprinopsis marcescibilis]
MELQNNHRQRSSPANDHSSSPSSPQNTLNVQQQLFMGQQQQAITPPGYTLPAQQQAQGNWTPSVNATPFYPSFYQPQLPQQSPQFAGQIPPQSAYFDQANAQLAQWAYQQMMFNAQHGFQGIPPQHHSPSQRPGGAQLGPNDYFANSIPSPFNNFPSGTPPPHNHRGGAGDHQGPPAQYPGFHPYRRPNRQQSHNSASPDTNDWRSPQPHSQLPHAPYMRSEASGSTSSVNSTGSHRKRTTSNQSGHSGHSVPATASGNRSRSNTASSAPGSSSARSSPSPAQSSSPSPSPLRNHHNRNGSSTSTSSTATATSTRPSGITPSVPTTATSPTNTSAAPSNPSPAPRLTRPSPLSQGNFTAEKRMSRDDSDIAVMLSNSNQGITASRSGGLKSRLRRALSFNPSHTLKEEDTDKEEDDTSIKASAINGASAGKLKAKAPALPSSSSQTDLGHPSADDGASSTATVQTKKKGRAASLFNARFNASTDNISLSSTVSSASVMIRKLGSLGNLARRNSLAGITSLFKDKDKDGDKDKDKKGKKKDKKGAKAEASEASVSHVTAELDRGGDWSASTDLNGLTPAAKLARQHTLKSNAEAAAKAKAERETTAVTTSSAANPAASQAATNGVNGAAPVGVPSWDKNTATRNGVQAPPRPSGGGIHINEDGTRVLVEEDEEDESDDGHYTSSQGHQNYNADGWDDDDWDGEPDPEEDITIRAALQQTSLEGDDVEPWAMGIRRSVERTLVPKKGILKNAREYSQLKYDPTSQPQLRTRSNSYNSPPIQSELGPLAHVPSENSDNIDGIHRSPTQQQSNPRNSVPSLPPLSFDQSSPIKMSFASPAKELPDTPSNTESEQSNRSSAIFQHPNFNSSAPVLSTIGSSAPTPPPRSASSQRRLTFATSLAVYDTFAATVYDRRSEAGTWSRLTPALAQRIKEELNSYKMEEMHVHASSRIQYVFLLRRSY